MDSLAVLLLNYRMNLAILLNTKGLDSGIFRSHPLWFQGSGVTESIHTRFLRLEGKWTIHIEIPSLLTSLMFGGIPAFLERRARGNEHQNNAVEKPT